MACISSPELDEQSLLAYIDGEAELDVQRHLKQCPHCQQRAQELAALQDRLTDRLYRALCPTPHELGEYHLGMLSPPQTKAIARHLANCPLCAREVNQLAEYLESLSPATEASLLRRVQEGVRVLVAKLVSGEQGVAGQPTLVPVYAGVRGEQAESSLYQADGIQVVIGIQTDGEHPGNKVILGLVIGLEIREVKAHLWQAHRLITTVPVDELGNFVISGLAPGSYELLLSGPEIEVHIQDLTIVSD